jgi:hypothetical protein
MYSNTKRSYFSLSLLITLAIVFLGYGFLGNLIYSYRTQSLAIICLLALSFVGIFALRIGLGGLIASMFAIAVVFFKAGIEAGIAATIAALFFLWFGLKSGESESRDPNKVLTLLEWIALAVTVILTIATTMATLQVLSGVASGVVVGTIAGAIAIVGTQIKESGLSPKIGLGVLTIASGAGLTAGIVFGLLTQHTVLTA